MDRQGVIKILAELKECRERGTKRIFEKEKKHFEEEPFVHHSNKRNSYKNRNYEKE